MNRNQKHVLCALAVFVGFKAVLCGGIVYSSRYYRKSLNSVSV